jgi:hypothetical protein
VSRSPADVEQRAPVAVTERADLRADQHAYRLHGYRLVSDADLGDVAPREQPGEAHLLSAGAVRISRGADRVVPADLPEGELVAELHDERRHTYYAFARRDGRLLLRFHGAVELDFDQGLTEGTAHVHPGFDPDVLGVLLPGTVMAARLILDGRLVLHASALRVGRSAVAFVGSPGMGKSTLAGLGMAAGFPLLTDDVLRADLGDRGVRVWPGASEVRLREGAVSVAGLASGASRRTADGRLALGSPTAAGAGAPTVVADAEGLPLACCVIPFPRRDVTEVTVRRVRPFTAFRQLVCFPRITGWCEPSTSARQLDLLGRLCELVPVYEADVPWGPPFDLDVVPRLLELLSVDEAGRGSGH